MKKLILVTNLLLIITFISCSKKSKIIQKDSRPQEQKEDPFNVYSSNEITKLDIIEALNASGIKIFKFDIGEFQKQLKFGIVIDEYVDGELINSESFYNRDNTYKYFKEETGNKVYYDYINQIKAFVTEKENELSLSIKTNGMEMKHSIPFKITKEGQKYFLRHYSKTPYEIGKKTPLFIFASTWKDKKKGFQRFCGAVDLSVSKADTEELLSNTPHYFSISFYTKEI